MPPPHRPRLRPAWAWAALFVALLALPATAAATDLAIPYQRFRLDNGLTVILHEDHTVPLVTVNLWFHVGSKDEAPRRTGFAHLFEHLMFMGTARVPDGEFDRAMEASGGQNNASTDEDRTNYFESGPAPLLATFLWLEADRLTSLPEAMTAKKLALQRDVVKNERRQGYENRPYGGVELALVDRLWPAGHPYHHPVIGSHADLSAATVKDVQDFFRTYYVPANATLVVAGDIEPGAARAEVERYFGWIPARPVPPHVIPAPARLANPATVRLQDRVHAPQLTLAWHAPALRRRGAAEATVLAALLGGGRSSRLQHRLVYETKLASQVTVHHTPHEHDGVLEITVTAGEHHSPAELETAVRRELLALALGELPSEREVERARAFVERTALETLDGLVARADALNEYESMFGDPGLLLRDHLSQFARVGPTDVRWIARQIFAEPDVAVVVTPVAH